MISPTKSGKHSLLGGGVFIVIPAGYFEYTRPSGEIKVVSWNARVSLRFGCGHKISGSYMVDALIEFASLEPCQPWLEERINDKRRAWE